MILVFREIDDERCEVELDGTHIIEMNHDDHGWDGMDTIRTAFIKAASIAGWKVEDQ